MIKFRKIKISTLILSLLLGAVSCDSVLDEQPISEIGTENFWNSNADAEAGVAAIYDAFQSTYSEKYFYWGEFRSDNFVSGGNPNNDNIEIVTQSLTEDNGTLKWNLFYQIINRANSAIKNIPTISGYDKNLLAEAYALRAYVYFDAVRVWGAVPLFVEPTKSIDDAFKPKTDGDTILNDVVLADLKEAERLMEASNRDFRFSRASVFCLKAEINMYLQNYTEARKALYDMIAIGGHDLVKTPDDWIDLFYNNPSTNSNLGGRGKIQEGDELIFSIRYNASEDRDNPGVTRANRSGIMALFYAGVPLYSISPVLERKWQDKFPIDSAGWVDKYPNVKPFIERQVEYLDVNGDVQDSIAPVYGDWRYFACREGGYQSFGSRSIGEARMSKWQETNYDRNNDDTDIVIYRYAGMLLLLAEAENQLDNQTVALDLVNQVRRARVLPEVTEAEFGDTKEARENYILDERQLELLGEAKRWWDLRRTKKAIEVLNPILDTIPGATQLNEQRLLFPIHIDHLTENPNLTQTLGY
ncbi:RagB/SusD family nutrient uptake outer membrane protein [Polaribacter sp. L3A8]|uniref:RagB/SusD family nutrient uptake outer membrane protein n=1 Tax=Polaribacter sp. L3A8 TaxID=2686361 RepID=UPI00131E9E30|nr:RagB/SusD family nutrient uptake outer membrane protein [Polaribacter sp. L3A8]